MSAAGLVDGIDWTELPVGSSVSGPHAADLKRAVLPGGERLTHCSLWGGDTVDEATAVQQAARRLGLTGRSLAGCAGQVWRALMPAEEQRALPTRWRALWHSSLHVGPMVATPGSYTDVAHYDRRAAYLSSLYLPMPTRPARVDTLAGRAALATLSNAPDWHGVAYCRVTVPDVGGDYGPLPVNAEIVTETRHGTRSIRRGTLWPVQREIEGVWAGPVLRAAIDLGCEVTRVYEMACVQAAPYLVRLADTIADGLTTATDDAERLVWKATYQRGWLKLRPASWRTWCVGERSGRRILTETTDTEEVERTWRQTRINPARLVMRPDVVSYVSAHHVADMTRAMVGSGLPVVAAHVDSLHVLGGGLRTGPAIGDYRLIERGPAEIRAVGSYVYEGGQDIGAGDWRSHHLLMLGNGERGTAYWKDRPAWSSLSRDWSPGGWPIVGDDAHYEGGDRIITKL